MKILTFLAVFLMSISGYAFDISISTSPVNAALLKASKEMGANVSFHSKASDALVKLVKKQVDMAVVPLFLAAKLKNDGQDISVVNTLFGDMLFVLNNNGKVNELDDLKGKKLYIGKGNGPLNLFPKILIQKAGLGRDVELVGSTAAQIAQLAASGKAEAAVLREPLVTMVMSKNEYQRRAINFQSEWKKQFGGRLIQAALVARQDFIKNNPDVLKAFQSKVAVADEWVRAEPKKAAELFVNASGRGKAKIVAKSIKSMQPRIETPDRQEVMDFIALLLQFFGKHVGGKMPNDDFVTAILSQ
jgi:NitT/TauT family transport system substrate-binding protein